MLGHLRELMPTNSRPKTRPRIAIIGGGIFGVTAALVLSRHCDIALFERAPALFRGATFANHGRQHFGFHYPRSPETARQCLASHAEFRSLYGDAEVMDFPNYYCVASQNSKVTCQQYLEFCDKVGLKYAHELPPQGAIDPENVALSLRAQEGVLDYATMEKIALSNLERQPSINVHLNQEVVSGRIVEKGTKELAFYSEDKTRRECFDFVINATYASYNTFCDWFGFETKLFQYNLQELNIVALPPGIRLGVTVMDGVFPSIIPMGRTNYHILAHVEASQLVRESSKHSKPLLNRVPSIQSNWDGVLQASAV